ncbi:unnamed protein product, partial [Prorocentrum cordatum]
GKQTYHIIMVAEHVVQPVGPRACGPGTEAVLGGARASPGDTGAPLVQSSRRPDFCDGRPRRPARAAAPVAGPCGGRRAGAAARERRRHGHAAGRHLWARSQERRPGLRQCGQGQLRQRLLQAGLRPEGDPATAVQMLNKSLAGGGPDGLFTLQPTFEGTLGFADLRPFKQGVAFIGQVHHMTSGPSHFNDTIDFTIAPQECAGEAPCNAEGSIIRAFSLSLIAGAYGDNGQNYKNIALV